MKTESMEIRVQSDEKAAFKEAAAISGIPLSAWVRERLRRAAIKDLTEAGRQIAFLQRARGDAQS
ncbi:MAG: DUF1778 domain-containing protein [Methylocella sp.]